MSRSNCASGDDSLPLINKAMQLLLGVGKIAPEKFMKDSWLFRARFAFDAASFQNGNDLLFNAL